MCHGLGSYPIFSSIGDIDDHSSKLMETLQGKSPMWPCFVPEEELSVDFCLGLVV